MCSVDKDTGVLRRDDSFDYSGKIVDVGKGFDAEQDIVEGSFCLCCGIFRTADNCKESSA